MRNDLSRPFETIESALEFMGMLENEVALATEELRRKVGGASRERYADALHLALYKVGLLHSHVQKSRRLLNDLGLIRKILTDCEMVRPNNERLAS